MDITPDSLSANWDRKGDISMTHIRFENSLVPLIWLENRCNSGCHRAVQPTRHLSSGIKAGFEMLSGHRMQIVVTQIILESTVRGRFARKGLATSTASLMKSALTFCQIRLPEGLHSSVSFLMEAQLFPRHES